MDENIQAPLVSGGKLRKLASVSGPHLLSIFVFMSFNLVDTYFIGLLGTDPLAAAVLAFPVSMIVASISMERYTRTNWCRTTVPA